MQLERMTSPDIAAALEAGKRTAVMALGAVEQHGPHLPLFMDAEHGTRLAVEVAVRLGDALVAPTVRVGCSEHHMGFAGTLTLREETFAAVVADCCASLAHHGFRRIALLPTHGGNFAPLVRMMALLRERVGPDCTIAAFTELDTIMRIWRNTIDAAGGPGRNVGGHADVAETSIMASLHPELVIGERAAEGFTGGLGEEVRRRLFAHGMKAVSENGILGDARGYSAEYGELCVAALADAAADHFAAAFRAGVEG